MKHHRNIRRIDNDTRRTHAWLVQVQRRGNVIIKMFSDNILGGKQKALSAALEYRDELILAAPAAERNLWHRTIVRRNNTSGIPGVGLYKRTNGSERWRAEWIDENGIRKSRTFSVSIYGKRKAKQLAIAERQRQLERIFEIKNTQVCWPNEQG
ncbi:AP2/ERF family transcription factor [Propionivibrio sp.]|uniref:AP2/ERF family transcription factor n=1 Tax=Propionivibrio sp. TaxID=2212460 RepID=UPI0026032C7C|nr:AP2/ERF family transcription factor [Propionivibrio sp.]